MIFLNRTPLSRRTMLRGSGVALALPLLEAMMPLKASAQQTPKRFIGFYYPNGTSPNDWEPSNNNGRLADNLSPCLQDLAGFGREVIWPACSAIADEITVVKNLHHTDYNFDIHNPFGAFRCHATRNGIKYGKSLDQKILERAEHRAPYPYLAMSGSGDRNSIHRISWTDTDQAADEDRNPRIVFDRLFGALEGSTAQSEMALRRKKLLDFVRSDVATLKRKLGYTDKLRVDEFENSLDEIESQLVIPESVCQKQDLQLPARNWHEKTKSFIDILALAMQCDLTRVATIQYDHPYSVNYSQYVLGDGRPDEAGTIGVGNYSDHFVSHKLGGRDRAQDLEAIDPAIARRLANERVILTSRFKVRRFANLVDKLRNTSTPTGNLLDESLVLYASENGNGDNHSLRRRPTLIAGRAGGFVPGRIIDSGGKQTAALHCAILNRFGFNLSAYGNPSAEPMTAI